MEQPLTTKISIPPLRTSLISRPTLLERLNQNLDRKLFLISAPAGFGKTTIVTEWVHTYKNKVVWFSLDEGDNDLINFLKYIIFTIQVKFPEIGEQSLKLLSSSQQISPKIILSSLINEIAKLPDPIYIVLDDYHVIEDSKIDEALAFFIEKLPPQLHLMIITRQDPQLPLARLRAQNQMIEIRTADLRFTLSEIEDFLNVVLSLNLSKTEIKTLESRTEGWIAGLQLAGISIQGSHDKTNFIQSFTGTHQYIMGFLMEEVLEQQTENVQNFLLETSILGRMNVSLCDAIIDNPAISSQEMLTYLDQANLFLLPLDNQRHWYRYHHLFADLLQQKLQTKHSTYSKEKIISIPDLHKRASKWFEENGYLLEAFHHSISANDLDNTERLLEGEQMPLQYRGYVTPIFNWLQTLPVKVLTTKPSLLITYASSLTMLGKSIDKIENLLQRAENLLDNSTDNQKNRDYIGQIAAIRAMLAIPINQIEDIIYQSNRALEYLSPENLPIRTNALWSLGFAHQLKGDRISAEEDLKQVLLISEASGNLMISIASLTNLGQLYLADKQLIQAKNTFEKVLNLAGDPPLPFACEALLGLAQIFYEWNQLEKAQTYNKQSLQLALTLENVDTPIMCHILFARLKIAHNDMQAAAEFIKNAQQFAIQNKISHRIQDIAKVKALLFLKQNNITQALKLAQQHSLPLIMARIHIYQKDGASALNILNPLFDDFKAKNWMQELFEVLLLQSFSYYILQDDSKAANTIEKALNMAAPSKLLRSFIDEGSPFIELLKSISTTIDMNDYLKEILITIHEVENKNESVVENNKKHNSILSPRELEVLQLIAQGNSNIEIGESLFLALNTIKGINRKLFQKLNAKNRTEAVLNARKLELL